MYNQKKHNQNLGSTGNQNIFWHNCVSKCKITPEGVAAQSQLCGVN